MRFLLASAVVLVLTTAFEPDTCLVYAQTDPQTPITYDIEQLNELLNGLYGADPENTPGTGVIVTSNNEVIARRQYGMASLEH